MGPNVVFSTSSVFPNTELAFDLASRYRYDGIELMVNHERRSQSGDGVRDLVQRYQIPVTAVHVPCLVITQPVWGWNPEIKLRRSVDLANEIEANTVIVHPPFRWQREFAVTFPALVKQLAEENPHLSITVENMYTVEKFGRKVEPYLCQETPALDEFSSVCLDTSHAAAARLDPLELYRQMGSRVRHLHLSDSTSQRGDEHLPPGHGTLPLAQLAKEMLENGFDGDVVLEVATGKLPESMRRHVTEECLEWTRQTFKQPALS